MKFRIKFFSDWFKTTIYATKNDASTETTPTTNNLIKEEGSNNTKAKGAIGASKVYAPHGIITFLKYSDKL